MLSYMITNNGQDKQLPNELTSTFKELKVLKHLRKAGITKSFGFSFFARTFFN